MSLILEKHFVFLEYFPASLKVLEQVRNCSYLSYWLHWIFKKQD